MEWQCTGHAQGGPGLGSRLRARIIGARVHDTEMGLTTGARLWWWRQWAGVELGSVAMGARATNTRAVAGIGGSGEQGTGAAGPVHWSGEVGRK